MSGRIVSRPQFRVEGRYYVDKDWTRIVAEDDPAAAYLYVAPGGLVPLEEAVRFGLSDPEGNPLDPLAYPVPDEGRDEDEDADEGADETGEKALSGPDENKLMDAPDENKAAPQLIDVDGIGETTEARLKEHGITTLQQFVDADDAFLLREVGGISPGKLASLREHANALLGEGEAEDPETAETEGTATAETEDEAE